MTDHQRFLRQLARRTGESLHTVSQRGFHEEPRRDRSDGEVQDAVLAMDCPGCGRLLVLADDRRRLPEFAECARCDAVFDYRDDEVRRVSLFGERPGDRRERNLPFALQPS